MKCSTRTRLNPVIVASDASGGPLNYLPLATTPDYVHR